jgi:hypothetical protein
MRRRTGVLSLCGTVCAALVVTTTACSTRQPPSGTGGSTHVSPAPSSSATTRQDNARALPRCRASDVRLAVVDTEAVMSQPFSDISLTSDRATPCVLSGYPRIRVQGLLGDDRDEEPLPLAISVHHGLYERADPGPHRVVLRPRGRLYFSIGTGTAYQGGLHPITLTRLVAVLPGTHLPMTVPIHLLATKPPDEKIPVGITAIAASRHP